MPEGSVKDVASLKVSVPLVPGVSAEVPIRWSFFRPVVQKLRKTPPEQLVRVVGVRGLVHINADDDGMVDVYLTLVNMTDRPLRVDDLQLDLFYVGHVTTSVAAPLFRPSEKPIPPFDTGEINFTIHLGAPAIRTIVQRMQKAQNVFSSPIITLTIGGRAHVFIPGSISALQRARAIRMPFTLDIRSPELHINAPSAQSLAR